MSNPLEGEALDQLFREARSHYAWLDKPVTDDTLRQLYEVTKWGPTSANGNPALRLPALARGEREAPSSARAG